MGCILSSTAYFISRSAIPDPATLLRVRLPRNSEYRNAHRNALVPVLDPVPVPVPVQMQMEVQMEVPDPVLNRPIGKLPVCNRTCPLPLALSMQNPGILSGGTVSDDSIPLSALSAGGNGRGEEQGPSHEFLSESIDDPETKARIDQIIGFICSRSDHEVALALVQKIQDNFRRQIYATFAKLNRILQSSGLQSQMMKHSFSRAEFEESRLRLIELCSMPSPRFVSLATRIEPVITRLYTLFWLIEYMPYVDF